MKIAEFFLQLTKLMFLVKHSSRKLTTSRKDDFLIPSLIHLFTYSLILMFIVRIVYWKSQVVEDIDKLLKKIPINLYSTLSIL